MKEKNSTIKISKSAKKHMAQNIPAASQITFNNGIKHPDLYLWDGWSYHDEEVLHLYCLALSRFKEDGTKIDSSERNSYPFHMRHFTSNNEGKTWIDAGCFLEPRLGKGLHDSKTIWSGSVEKLPNGKKLVGYTGIYDIEPDRCFLQNIAIAISDDGYKINAKDSKPISSPLTDWAEITKLGYYLDQPNKMGHKDGEGGGPIMAWRDPFIYVDQKDDVHMFWGAKINTHQSAIAHALLKKDGDLFSIAELYPPITLPDSEEFTQLELPKIYYNKGANQYVLIIASCNRLYEGQSDDEVNKGIRIYTSKAIHGPWIPNGDSGSNILQGSHRFGLTVLRPDFKNNRLLCIAPYTEAASPDLSLTFSEAFYLDLK